MKHFLSAIAVFVFTILFIASTPSKEATQAAPTKKTFTYDYKTSSPEKLGSAKILIAIVKPAYSSKFLAKGGGSALFTYFQENFQGDIRELLIDKGYHVTGTDYEKYDEIIFTDKKDADIAVEITIAPEIVELTGSWNYNDMSLGGLFGNNTKPQYKYKGSITLKGDIILNGYEPLTHERIWYKSVSIQPIENIELKSYGTYEENSFTNAFYNDPNIYNSIGAALQQQYFAIMQKIDAYFDPREFQSLKPQIKELKAKKGY